MENQRQSPDGPAATKAQIASVAMGNALEFYDFLVFSFFAVQIGHTFFPTVNPINSLLAALATFGAGFITRPIGAWVIGRFGDRVGRKPAMILSFTMIGASSLAVALVPSYATIGIAAPILVISLRLLQGFALGGEIGPSSAFLAETGPPERRGRLISLQFTSQGLAVLVSGIVGTTLANMLSETALIDWGWRVAMAVGAAIVPIGIMLRRSLPETHDPIVAKTNAKADVRHGRIVVLGFLIMTGATIGTYVLSYLTTYAQTVLKLPPSVSFWATVASGLGYVLGGILGGWAADKWGRKVVMAWPMIAAGVMVLPGFWLANAYPGIFTLVTVAFVLRLALVVPATAGFIAVTEGIAQHVRSGILSIVYALAISVFGGTTQFVIAWLTDVTANPMAPAWYTVVAIAVASIAMLMMPETRPLPAAKAGKTPTCE